MPGGDPTKKREPKLLDQVRNQARLLHLARRTEKAYVQWIERFLRFHHDRDGRWRHPDEMGSAGVNAFLTHLAVDRDVASSTQNQAFSALLFLFRKVLERDITIDAVRAKHPQRLPTVLAVDEVRRLLAALAARLIHPCTRAHEDLALAWCALCNQEAIVTDQAVSRRHSRRRLVFRPPCGK